MRTSRKSKQLMIALWITIALLLSFIIKTTFFDSKQKTNSLRAEAQSIEDHQNRNVLIAAKNTLLPRLPAHPVSKNITELEKTIDDILENERLHGAITGVSVRRLDNDASLFSSHADTRLIPASNMKILTTVAALETLGSNYQFSTEVSMTGKLKNGVLKGDLYLVGKGDPTLQKADFDELAKMLKDKGVKSITGSIYADDSWYDDVRYSQDLSWRHEFNYVGNAISALTASPNEDFLGGSVIVDIYPGETVGEKPEIVITPETDYITVVNKGKTVGNNEPLTLTDERKHGTNTLIIEGNIPMNSQHYQRWRSVWEPAGYALDLFTKSLQEQNIKYNTKEVKTGVAPKGTEVLLTKKSMPLKELIITFMKISNNGIGEVLVKEMGKIISGEGSWDSGLAVMEDTLAQLGMNTRNTVLRDGSGMSDNNLVSPNAFTHLLKNIQDESWFPHFENSLPFAGEPGNLVGGTLNYRMTADSTRGNVKAKTGNLKGVSTLSGYVTTADGIDLAFSIMMNNYIYNQVTDIQDQIVTVLAEAELE